MSNAMPAAWVCILFQLVQANLFNSVKCHQHYDLALGGFGRVPVNIRTESIYSSGFSSAYISCTSIH